MGGFGAMEVALSQLRRYSVVESWEGFFDNLSSLLAADRSLLARMPLHAFVYGGRNDTVANPAEDASWAAALRARRRRRAERALPGRAHLRAARAPPRADAHVRGSRAAQLTASAISCAWSNASAGSAPSGHQRASRASSPPRASSSAGARMRYAIEIVGPRGSRPGAS